MSPPPPVSKSHSGAAPGDDGPSTWPQGAQGEDVEMTCPYASPIVRVSTAHVSITVWGPFFPVVRGFSVYLITVRGPIFVMTIILASSPGFFVGAMFLWAYFIVLLFIGD